MTCDLCFVLAKPEHLSGDRYGFLISFPYLINDESFDSSSFWFSTQVLASGSMACLVVSLFVMSVMLFKLDSHGFDDSWLAKLCDSFDVTLQKEVIFQMEFINPL